MQHVTGLPLVDIRIVEVVDDGWQLRVEGEPVLRFATRDLAKQAALQRCRLAARQGHIVRVTIVEAKPGPEFDQLRTGLFYERAGPGR